MVSTIWGICFSLKANPSGSNTKSFDTVLPRCDGVNDYAPVCSPIDPVFEFSEIGHHGIERWSFSKEHFPHVSVPGLSQQRLGPRADVIRRVKVAVRLAEDQVVGSITGSKSNFVLVLPLPVRSKNAKGKVVQANSAPLAGLRALDS